MKILLSAAHCVVSRTAARWKAFTYRLALDTPTSSQIVYPVIRIHSHPAFDSNTYDNDVAIFVLGTPEANDGTYQAAYIDINRDGAVPAAGESLKAIGWGTTSFLGSLSNNLLEVDVPYIPTAQCMTADWSGSGTPYGPWVDFPSMLCAGEAGKDTCQGDSGGPLMIFSGGRWLQVGITSWGNGCASFPGVYSRVSQLSSWIDEIVALETSGGTATVTSYLTTTSISTSVVTSVVTSVFTSLSISVSTSLSVSTSVSVSTLTSTATQTIFTPSPSPVPFPVMTTRTLRITSWRTTRTIRRTVFRTKTRTRFRTRTRTVTRFVKRRWVGSTVVKRRRIGSTELPVVLENI